MLALEEILLPAGDGQSATPIRLLKADDLDAQPAPARAWAKASGYEAAPGDVLLVPGEDGALASVLVGAPDDDTPSLATGALSRRLPAGLYRFADMAGADGALAALGWLLEAYDFARYRKEKPAPARLICPGGVKRADVLEQARAMWLARDLVNTPVEDLGPAELAAAATGLAADFGAQVDITTGEALAQGYPLIHAVGRAATKARAPRLIDLTWGAPDAPKLTLVGKGVCFDTGGLDIKPASGIILMKKDMGGAAAVLALARMVMAGGLDVRLRVLVPAVENVISSAAYRPSDVIRSRAGISVEVGNTDAEGRLVLADALAAADEEAPDMLIDMATLTGAARVALGPQIAALFTPDDDLAAALGDAARLQDDPLWRLPLWRPYMEEMKSSLADTSNVGSSGHGGAIIAALFLSRFVKRAAHWAHIDQSGWNFTARPARPKGGEALAVRALFAHLKERFGKE